MLAICKVCGAENIVEGDTVVQCYNCDNDLPGTANAASRSTKTDRCDDSIHGAIAAVYFFIFILGLGSYLLAMVDRDPQSDMLCFPFVIIAIVHLFLIKHVNNISGFYKGPRRHNIVRRFLLYGIIGLFVCEIVTTNDSCDKNRVLSLLTMMSSLMLFYAYYFGKKTSAFNYFDFFYDNDPKWKAIKPIQYSNKKKRKT